MDTVFGLYVCQKSTYQLEIQHDICPCIGLQYILRFFENFENFGYIKISVFNIWGVKETFLRKSEIAV